MTAIILEHCVYRWIPLTRVFGRGSRHCTKSKAVPLRAYGLGKLFAVLVKIVPQRTTRLQDRAQLGKHIVMVKMREIYQLDRSLLIANLRHMNGTSSVQSSSEIYMTSSTASLHVTFTKTERNKIKETITELKQKNKKTVKNRDQNDSEKGQK